jgi:hypothetical protein
MFVGVDMPCERIFCILGIHKSDFEEVAEVMIQVGKWRCKLIICLLDVLENDFGEVDKAMFLGVEKPCEHIFCIVGI